jgi:ATP synthase protein I
MQGLKIMVRPTSKRARKVSISPFLHSIRAQERPLRQVTERAMTEHREEDLEERRRRLASELAVRDGKARDEGRAESNAEQTRKGYGMAMKISSEFISAIIVGALLGYLFDHFVGTGPWGMIVMLLIGFCAGVLNVMRVVGYVASPHPADRRMDLDDKGDGR